MRIDIKQIVEKVFEESNSKLIMEDYLIREGTGFTKAVEHLSYSHSGISTSRYYVASMFMGKMEEEEGLNILKALQTLQIQMEDHPKCGGFYVFREEIGHPLAQPGVNAAAFILQPLIILYLMKPELIPESNKVVMERMFSYGVKWFSKVCKETTLYYPNNIRYILQGSKNVSYTEDELLVYKEIKPSLKNI